MKIVRRLLIVLVIGVIAGGATWSFFSDTETSSGNTFTAGQLDLTVDNESHYNGLVCQDDIWTCEPWADVAVLAEEQQGTKKNGDPVNPDRSDLGVALGEAESSGADYDTVVSGSFYSLGFGGSVVLKFDNLILNEDGNDLKVYEITGGNSYPDEKAEVAASQDGVSWTVLGEAIRDEEFDLGPLAWAKYIRITDTSDEGIFEATADGYDLDAITALHCGSASDYLEGTECHGSWELAELGAHKLFEFNDVKPGDLGEDTVSLHVEDNDAWGRMVITVTDDSDNTCVEPELDPVDADCVSICTTPGCAISAGELRENLNFEVWLDEGITPGFQGKDEEGNIIDVGEGDNRKQESELPLIIEPGAINADGETWYIKDALNLSYVKNGESQGITADKRMVKGITYYFGIGWELPFDGVGNEVQTDQFMADIAFEIEQHRNNETPFEN